MEFKLGITTVMENRHRDYHLSVATAFCNCVAQCCEVFGGNYAIAVQFGNVAAVCNEKTGCNGLATEVVMQLMN